MKRTAFFLFPLIALPITTGTLPAFATDFTVWTDISAETTDEQFMSEGFAQAAITFSVKKGNSPAADISLTVKPLQAENRGAVTPAFSRKLTGLSWNSVSPGNLRELSAVTLKTDAAGQVRVLLFDILGERSVSLALLSPQGELMQTVKISFGRGPLSRFTPPLPQKVTWNELSNLCGGKDKVPTVALLQTVSLQGKYNPNRAAHGAAVAAGWPTDERYLAERFVIPGRARHVDLLTGSPHGSGGVSTGTPSRAVCSRPAP